MGRGIALVNAAKARGFELLADTGLLSPSGRRAAVASLMVVLISFVTGHPEWGSAGVVPLAVLACAQMVQAARQAQQARGDVLAGDVLTGTARYGVVRFATGQGGPPGRFLSTVMSSAYVEFPAESAKTGSVIGLKEEAKALKNFLKDRQSKVILVHGLPGAGKSMLVRTVLREMGLESEARSHDLAPHDRLDAKALLDDIESGPRTGAALKPGEDLLGRLGLAVEAPRGARVIIVVDGAQSLFGPGNHMDSQLAEALEVIARGRRRVKVILVAQDGAVPGTGGSWHGTTDRVFVGGLHREDFYRFLEGLNPAFEWGLVDRTTTEPGGLYDVLQGNPRQAEMFCAAVGLPRSRLSADDFARQLALEQPRERGRLLASEVVNSLSPDQRRVAATLAACGIPVTVEQVNDVLTERRNTLVKRENGALVGEDSQTEVGDDAWTRKLSADQVRLLASELVNWRVIDRVAGKGPDRYRLTAAEIYDALLPANDLSADLLWDAANVMFRYKTPDERIRKPEDLRWHFAGLDILLREASLTSFDDPLGPLYEHVQPIERAMKPVLRRGNAEGLLLRYREAIQGKLRMPDSDYLEMVNSNALGCIYLARGRFRDARQAFDHALQHASGATSSHDLRKIFINLAALSWLSGDTSRAKECYEEALDCTVTDPAGVTERPDVLDLIAAEAGLAQCYRRWGRYGDAIGHGMKALNAAQGQDSPSLVDIAVKLARWQSELNDEEEAGRLMKKADRAAKHDRALRVHCLAEHADLLLDAGHFRRAGWAATKARRTALRLRDTVTVLRASTTLATAHLMLGRIAAPRLKLGHIAAARRAIDRATRCQRASRSMEVMALQALIAFRSAPDGEEARGLFAELEDEARQRLKSDKWDFAALDFKGLASCGADIRGTASLDEAVKDFRCARELVSAPGLDTRLERSLEVLQTKAARGRLSPVMAAISGAAAPS
jgi:tetratricopeptide (TPR) repeat protein